jgi:hypothetical protein
MRIFIFSLLILFCVSCGQSDKNIVEQPSEDSFEAPENPFKGNDEENEADSTKKAKKAEKPGMKPAKIEFTNKEIRFDSMPAGKIFKTELTFANSGEQPLEISSVRSSQKAEMNWSKLLIAASEQSSIGYKIKGPDKKGTYIDTIFILSNSGEDKIVLKGQVR